MKTTHHCNHGRKTRGMVLVILVLLTLGKACVLPNPVPESGQLRSRRQVMASGACIREDSDGSLSVNTTNHLAKLRQKMLEHGIRAYIIPMGDEHQSEYVAPEDKRIEFISGFSGSAGTAVVTVNEAALWTDGRYFLQAESQLDCNWKLMRQNQDGVPTVMQWLGKMLKQNETIGVNSKTIDYRRWTQWLKETEKSTKYLRMKALLPNLVDDIWDDKLQSRNADTQLFILDEEFAGKSWREKVEDVRGKLSEKSVDALIVSALDNNAWLLNLRGNDFEYTPIFKAYVIVGLNFTRLYVRSNLLSENVTLQLLSDQCADNDCIQVREYDDIEKDMEELGKKWNKIWMPPTSSHFVYSFIPENKRLVESSPIALMQAVKNPTEIQGMKNAHIRDAVALIDFLALLEDEVKSGKHWDELRAAKVLQSYRSEQKYNRGASFPVVSAFGSNGAIIHYRPSAKTNKVINMNGTYLLDSGGQYLDGTTDVTRTLHFGNATDFQKEMYTRVLKGVINVAKFTFPSGTTDLQVDILARTPLFEVGLDYRHGTGHGIGAYLCVHEGPFLITWWSKNYPRAAIELEKGMFMSDEPGFYQENEFGIRLENIITVVEAKTPYTSVAKSYLTFESVTLVPFEPHLIDVKLLSDSELEWLNDYHATVEKIVGPKLVAQSRTKGYQWMLQRTKPIQRQKSGVNVECESE